MEDRITTKFIKELSKIKDPAIFLGVARVLKVELMVDKDTPRDFGDVFEDIIVNYENSNRKRRRELLKILQQSNKCKEEVVNGNRTQSSSETGSDENV